MPIISTEHLTKEYVSHERPSGLVGAVSSLFSRKKKIVQAATDINLQIEPGELVGFLGPNGAGKTTTLKMLTGILFPTSGSAQVLGYTPWERRPGYQKQMSLVMGQKNQLWWDLPAEESFILLKEIYEVPADLYRQRLKKITEMLEIDHLLSTQVRKMSLGERMKCELTAALLHAPKVVFLDEPTIGLDVVSQKRIREFIKDRNREDGCTILLTSHYMDDVRALCQRVIIIDQGTLIFDNTLSRLMLDYTENKRLKLTFSAPVLPADLQGFGRVVSIEEMAATLEVKRPEAPQVASALLSRLPVLDIEITEPDIEDVIRDVFQRTPRPSEIPSSKPPVAGLEV